MPAKLFYLPFRPAIDPNGLTVSGAQLYFYAAGTLTPLPVYADEALTVPLESPVQANPAGKWPAIYLDEAVLYRAVLKDEDGAVLDDADPYLASVSDELTPELAGVVTDAQTAASNAATSAGAAAAQVPLAAAEVTKAQEWSDGTEPGGPGTLSAKGWAAASALATRGVNMWPDPMFKLSAGNFDYEADGYRLYSRASGNKNATWDANFKHPYGVGAWVYNSALTTLMGFETHLAGSGTGEFDLAPGDVVSIAVEVVASSGTVSIAARFFSAVTPTAYTHLGLQINGSASVVMDGTPKVLKVNNLTIPVGAIGFQDYLFDGVASDFKVLRRWVVKSSAAADSPPVRGTDWEEAERSRVAVGDPHGPEVEWMVQPAVVYDDATVVLPVSGISDGTVNAAITGWASALDPAGVSFNAVTVRGIRQPDGATPLAAIGVVVRKGALNTVQNAGSTVVAVGSLAINPALSVHPSTTIPLRDPASGNFLTLSDTQLNTDEYAVMVYGITATGTRTAIVQPRGITDNQLGRTFYVTTNDPATAVWLSQTTPLPVGVEHVLLDNMRDGFGPTDTYAQQIADKIGGGTPANVEPSPYGQRLRRFRAFTAARGFNQSARYSLALVGDSWSTSSTYLARDFTNLMIGKYGDGGVGWCGFGFTSGNPFGDARGVYSVTRTGAWTSNYHAGSTSPNIGDARSSTAADKLTVTSASGATAPALSAVKLHFKGTANGVIRWRWNAGAWSANTNVQGTLDAQQTVDLTGFPATVLSGSPAGTIVLEIEVVSGSVILSGLDMRSASDGIVIHKLGSSGSKASDWLASNAAQWQAAIALLGIDGAQMLFGTNEDSAGQSPDQVAANYASLASRLRTASPSCDLLLAVAPDNHLANATDMTGYAAAIYALVDGSSPDVFAAFCDLQPAYGDPANKAEYASTGTLPLFLVDGAHPNATGSQINARESARVWSDA